ncbi:tetratricopeptide repeat protein [Marinobacterium lutimaris]|uniref:Alginate biosynthesis protein AlgK n=1 Tax=Marinobacterium lutimaris TaxID=568106 RepID=A0A1H6CVW7_9GAMM|nr:sel1 repeat family protein [Marinobacterium lutimaris]SEG77171.1 alginate biosynthesis protein AlgK [Marinobacterium lutimaris]
MRLAKITTVLAALAAFGLSSSAQAALSLEQVRYELFKNPQAEVEKDLRQLSDRGNREAMYMLANLLADRSGNISLDSLRLYDAAFAKGTGEVRALAGAAALVVRRPFYLQHYTDYFAQALQQYPQQRDLETLNTTLEVFLVYPDLFQPDVVQQLLDLHRRSCIELCSSSLYAAVLAERRGQRELADQHYREAMLTDERAAERYYDFLGDEQERVFAQVAAEMEPRMEAFTPAAAERIGTLLDRIGDLRSASEKLARRQQLQEAEQQGIEPQPVAEEGESESQQLREQALRWVNYAASRDWLPGMTSLFNFMTSDPTSYTGDEAMALIDRIGTFDPARAERLRIFAYMVSDWDTLAPRKAYELIQRRIDAGQPDGSMLLAGLYSEGVLDEADQPRALSMYEELASQGSGAAYFRLASLHNSGLSMCHDRPLAYAYAQVAASLGVARAQNLERELAPMLTEDEMDRATRIRNEAMERLPL